MISQQFIASAYLNGMHGTASRLKDFVFPSNYWVNRIKGTVDSLISGLSISVTLAFLKYMEYLSYFFFFMPDCQIYIPICSLLNFNIITITLQSKKIMLRFCSTKIRIETHSSYQEKVLNISGVLLRNKSIVETVMLFEIWKSGMEDEKIDKL